MHRTTGVVTAMLAILGIVSCASDRRGPAAPPSETQAGSTTTTNASIAPARRSMESKTIGFDHATVTAPSGQPSIAPAPPPAPTAASTAPAREPGKFWAPTTPATGVMNPSPPEP
jgi:hypothetical protein